jgi:hypothetical protein
MDELQPPLPILSVSNCKAAIINISIVTEGEDKKIVVEENGHVSIYDDGSKYRAVLLTSCNDCEVYVEDKLLKLCLLECENTRVTIASNMIGIIEMFKCNKINVILNREVPVIQLGFCNNVVFNQHIDQCAFALSGCIDIFSIINGKINRIPCYPFDSIQLLSLCNANGIRSMYDVNHLHEILVGVSVPPA